MLIKRALFLSLGVIVFFASENIIRCIGPSCEQECSVFKKFLAKHSLEKFKHCLKVLVKSRILTIENNQKSINKFLLFQLRNHIFDMMRIFALLCISKSRCVNKKEFFFSIMPEPFYTKCFRLISH